MAALDRRDLCDYEQIFTLFRVAGSSTLTPANVRDILLQLGFCSSSEEAEVEARHFITKYDSSRTGSLSLEDFLLVAEDLELAIKYLRQGVKQSLAYFTRRKSEQIQEQCRGPGPGLLQAEDLMVILRAGVNALPRNVVNEVVEDVLACSSGKADVGAAVLQLLFPNHNHRQGRNKGAAFVPEVPHGEAAKDAAKMLVQVMSGLRMESFAHGVFVDSAEESKIQKRFNPVLVFESATEYQETSILQNVLHPEWNQDLWLKFQPGTTDPVALLDWIEQERYVVSLCDFRDDGITSWKEVVATGILELSTILYNSTPDTSLPLVLSLTPTMILSPTSQQAQTVRNPQVELLLSPPAAYISFYHQVVCSPREDLSLRIEKVRQDLCRGLERDAPGARRCTHTLSPSMVKPGSETGQQAEEDTAKIVSLSRNKFVETSSDRTDKGGFSSFTMSTASDGTAELSSWFEYPNMLYPIWQNAVNRYARILPSRPIGSIARDENGTFRFLPAFVQVVPDCGFDSAQDIAREIAKLDCTNGGSLGLGYRLWNTVINSPTLILRLGRGNLLELAVLLCSFFLGVNLNAFVCVGSREDSTLNAWVVVMDQVPVKTFKPNASPVSQTTAKPVVHWNVQTGQRYVVRDDLFSQGFRKVNFLFNHENLWANIQCRSLVDQVTWDVNKPKDWEPLLPDTVILPHGPIQSTYHAPVFALFCPGHKDALESKLLSCDLREAVVKFRTHRLFLPFTQLHNRMCAHLKQLLGEGASIPGLIELDGIAWNVSTFLFHSLCLNSIMHRLEALGVLHNSGPQVEYAVAAHVATQSWGIRDVTISIATSIMPQNICGNRC